MQDEYVRTVTALDRNHDGDSLWLTVSLGFRASITESFRLLGIDSPELKAPTLEAARASRDYLNGRLRGALAEGREVTIKSYKPFGAYTKDKYGRWLAVIFVDGIDVNQEMVQKGYAVPYFGGQRGG